MRRYALAINGYAGCWLLIARCWLLGDGGVSGKGRSLGWEESGMDGMAGIMRLIRPAKHPPGKPCPAPKNCLTLPVKVARTDHMIRTVFGLEV